MAKPKDEKAADKKAETTSVDTTPAETPDRVDHVASVSRRADGTPDQTPGYVVVGEHEDD